MDIRKYSAFVLAAPLAIAAALSSYSSTAQAQQNCTDGSAQSLFYGSGATPQFRDATDGTSYELGTYFTSSVNGKIVGVRYWRPPSEPTAVHSGRIWSGDSGRLLTSTSFQNETPEGWQYAPIDLRVLANQPYLVTVDAQSHYTATNDVFQSDVTGCNLTGLATEANGAYGPKGFFPTNAYRRSNYFRDVVFIPTDSIIAINAGDERNPIAEFTGGYVGTVEGGNAGRSYVVNNTAVDRSGASDPAPARVYESARMGAPGFQYTLAGIADANGTPNLTIGQAYRVRLHFVELNYAAAGQRRFNVSLNGTQVLTDFDIVQAAGAPMRVNIQEFEVLASSIRGIGAISAVFTAGSAGLPVVSAIEVLPVPPVNQR